MRQFAPCNDCGHQIPIPEIMDGPTAPQFLRCEACGREVFWNIGLTNDSGPLIVFSIGESEGIDTPPLEFELESEADQESDSDSESDWSLDLGTETTNFDADSIENEGANQVIIDRAESVSPLDWIVLGATKPRRRPKEISAFRKIIPPILGGLAAFPIATLIMWYVVGQDIGFTGPRVAQYVPWIVPQKLRSTLWEYSRNSQSFGSSEPRISSPTPRVGLPKLNREESMGEPSETFAEQSAFPPKEAVSTEVEVSMPVAEAAIEKPSISETIVKLQELQKEWNAGTPVADRDKMVGEFNTTITRLSEQAAELKGPPATISRKELEAMARQILSHPNIPKAIQLGPIGKLSGIPAAATGDFIATIIKIGDKNSPAPNSPWILKETWSTTTSEIPIEVMPGAWRASSATFPTTCLLLGQLVANETSTGTILRVYSILPQ